MLIFLFLKKVDIWEVFFFKYYNQSLSLLSLSLSLSLSLIFSPIIYLIQQNFAYYISIDVYKIIHIWLVITFSPGHDIWSVQKYCKGFTNCLLDPFWVVCKFYSTTYHIFDKIVLIYNIIYVPHMGNMCLQFYGNSLWPCLQFTLPKLTGQFVINCHYRVAGPSGIKRRQTTAYVCRPFRI